MGKKSREKAARRERFVQTRTAEPSAQPEARPAPVQRPPVIPSAIVQQVRRLLQGGQPAEALQLLQQNRPAPGQTATHRNLVALCLVGLNQNEQAYPLLEAATAEFPSDFELNLSMAQVEANLGLLAHMERRTRKLTQSYGNHPGVVQARDFARKMRAEREQRAREMGISAESLERAIYLVEASYSPLHREDWRAVEETSRAAIAACPTYEPAYAHLGTALIMQGLDDDSVAVFEAIASGDSSFVLEANLKLTYLYLSLGARQTAVEHAEALRARLPEARAHACEAFALLGDDRTIITLLGAARGLSPREHFILAVARGRLGDFVAGRRELEASTKAGYSDPLLALVSDGLNAGRMDIPYISGLDLLRPSTARLMRSVSPDSDPALRQELVDRLSHDVELTEIVRQTLLENPPAAVRILCAAGTPECLRLVREFALGTAGSVQDRLIALSAMREAGEIAEDEPVELQVDGDIRVVTPGRHRIVPDSPIELPDQETAALFFEGARLLDPSPEDAYERWKQVDARFSSARIKTHLARLSQNLGRLSESREWLEKALEIEPDLVEAHVAMATTYLMEGNLRPALDHARIVEEAAVVTVSEFMGYQAVRDNINGIMSSPMADALLAQADMASDEETADANRDLANLLGSMQKSLALTQYLRQRPILALREDLALHEIVDHLDPTVLYNAAWLFGMVDEMEALSPDDEDDDPDGERDSALSEQRIHQARERIANALLDPQRLMEGLPGLGDRDIRGLAWMLDRGGITPLDDYLKEFPPDEAAPGDMLLEYGIVAEGRLAGKVTRMVPVDLRGPLMRAMEQLGG